jgi:hypothetical protein
MDLSGSWDYIDAIARSRLAHNKTSHHVSEFGEGIEIIGVAGELVARRFLGISEKIHEGFDDGHDFIFAGMTVDVKATILTPNVQYRYLQWPQTKTIKAQIVFMTGVDPVSRHATVIGYATKDMVMRSPINRDRFTPCHELPISELIPPFLLIAAQLRLLQGARIGR